MNFFVATLLTVFFVFPANTLAKGSDSDFPFEMPDKLFVEPFGSYALGNHEIGSTTSGATGWYYGIRAGPKFGPLTFGLEVSAVDGEINLPAGKYKSRVGLFAGYAMLQFEFGLRIYGAFAIDDKLEYKDNPSITGAYKGFGMKIGLGYRFMSNLALSAEYYSNKFDEYDRVEITDTNLQPRVDYTMLVLSIPVVIGEK